MDQLWVWRRLVLTLQRPEASADLRFNKAQDVTLCDQPTPLSAAALALQFRAYFLRYRPKGLEHQPRVCPALIRVITHAARDELLEALWDPKALLPQGLLSARDQDLGE